jgi:hypothetical protein
VFDIVAGGFPAGVAGSLSALFFLTLWVAYPLAGHRGVSPQAHQSVSPGR